MQYKWTALTVTTVGILLASIDARILIIGLPTIAKQLHAGGEEVIWISQAYLLSGTVCLLLVGRIADLFGKVKLYNMGFVIFTVGSALAAISQNPYQLIGFRIFQGVGYGILMAIGTAIITDASPKNELGTLLGINNVAWRVGSVSGLTLSGLILSIVDWRGLFYVNIPIGIFGTLWAYKSLREISVRDLSEKMDWIGFSLFAVGIFFVLLAITFLSYGVSGSLEGYAFLTFGIVVLILYVVAESKISYPLLDLGLFKIRLFAMGNLALVINSLVFNGAALLIAFYLQLGRGYSPLHAGLSVLPLDAFFTLSSVVCGRLSDKYGSRVLASTGLSIITVALLYMFTFGATTPYLEIVVVLSIIGTGNGMFSSPNTRAIMGSVPANRRGIANGFRSTMYNIGLTSSYGLMVLFITLGIPYGLFTLLLQGSASGPLMLSARAEFLSGFQIAALILAVLEAIAIAPSLMRGKTLVMREPDLSPNEK